MIQVNFKVRLYPYPYSVHKVHMTTVGGLHHLAYTLTIRIRTYIRM